MPWNSLSHPSSATRKAGCWLLIFTICTSLAGCIDVTCDGNDSEAVAARALSKERLERLYTDIANWGPNKHWTDVYLWDDAKGEVPEQFKDIGAGFAERTFDGNVVLRLRGCMDHHLDLIVVLAKDEDPRIELRYGEGPTSGQEILWRRGDG